MPSLPPNLSQQRPQGPAHGPANGAALILPEWEAIERQAGDLLSRVDMTHAALAEIISLLKLRTLPKPIDVILSIPVYPAFITLKTHGRQHTLIWSNGSLAAQLDMGSGYSTITLQNGWNVLDVSEGAALCLPASASAAVNVRYRNTDYPVSNLYHG